ncbi:MAG: hypothetical protein ACJ70Y_03685 [Nitrososphaera sp.]
MPIVSWSYATPPSGAVVYVIGVGGGWVRLRADCIKSYVILAKRVIDGLLVRYRHPPDLLESIFDTLTGIAFLSEVHRIKPTGLAGHSFGGSAIIQADIASPNIVTTIASLATQSYGASEAISKLNQRPSTLLIHGNDDKVLPFYCLQQV